ncbi:phosphonate ABC transporter, permease protein PhnE [Thalassobaculum fulvum]|uniref:Phosphonate ABC transporter, permease protein PhnE n=1 Tax=Thalassobaculum fulvum TaxID=1633335 RepID=A0A918XRY2_9PROT|nr:phosphonate ABC transporter, permease protein PhnE [Thalassobaculum fulvum]GHD46995.1 phosphonate ABC transporter, permease protein PhnE [Thalassobaculum fulvum]
MSSSVATMTAAEIAALRERFPEALSVDRRRRWTHRAVAAGIVAYMAFCVWVFDITVERLFGGLGKMWIVVRSMLVWKDMASWDYLGIFQGLAETLGMAFLGTFVASLFAVVIGFAAARNVVPNRIIHHLVRRFLDLLRGVDTLIWALVFVRAVGLGPLAGVLSIMVSDTGTLSKLYSEAVENVDRKPIEGVRSTGAGNLKVYRFGYLPQVLPVFLSTSLYWFESNTRSATILGIVGAGGIGMQLSERMKVQYWDQACFIIVLILLTVAIIDTGSKWIRLNLIGRREL